MPDPILKIEEELVNITPPPVLPWLERLNNRMTGCMEMLGGVLILRIVAAADMPTFEADAQVHPGVADFQAILAPVGARCDLPYLVKMTTLFCHCARLPFSS